MGKARSETERETAVHFFIPTANQGFRALAVRPMGAAQPRVRRGESAGPSVERGEGVGRVLTRSGLQLAASVILHRVHRHLARQGEVSPPAGRGSVGVFIWISTHLALLLRFFSPPFSSARSNGSSVRGASAGDRRSAMRRDVQHLQRRRRGRLCDQRPGAPKASSPFPQHANHLRFSQRSVGDTRYPFDSRS